MPCCHDAYRGEGAHRLYAALYDSLERLFFLTQELTFREDENATRREIGWPTVGAKPRYGLNCTLVLAGRRRSVLHARLILSANASITLPLVFKSFFVCLEQVYSS